MDVAGGTAGGRSITIGIADGHELARAGLRLLLAQRPGFEVVGEAGSASAALVLAQQHCPDVLILHPRLDAGSGTLPVIRGLAVPGARTRSLVLGGDGDSVSVRDVLRAGAAGYLPRAASVSELVEAVREVARGRTFIPPALGAQLALQDQARDELSRREVEVLGLLGRGYTNREIAEQLVLSVRTIESHRRRIQEKLGISCRHELVELAMRRGLVGAAAQA